MRKALWFVLVVALTGVATSVVSGDGSAASAATSPTWQKIPGLRPEIGSGPPPPIGSASGRVWFALGGPEGSLSMTATSATVSGGTLKSVKTTRLADEGLYARLIVGSELLYSTDANGVGKFAYVTRKLLASGGLGAPTPAQFDAAAITTKASLAPQAGVLVGGRTVWTLPGQTKTFSPRGVLWVCCTPEGSAVELTKLITSNDIPPLQVRLRVDDRDRLWLAWLDAYQTPRASSRLVQLDPDTLAPVRSKAFVAPAPGITTLHDLACAATCRVVMWQHRNGLYSWAPGEGGPTKIDLPKPAKARTDAAAFLAASYRSGGLAIAYTVPASKGFGSELRVARGDVRGRRLSVAGSSGIPPYAGPDPNYSPGAVGSPYVAFVPAGLLAVQPYQKIPEGTLVMADVIRLAR